MLERAQEAVEVRRDEEEEQQSNQRESGLGISNILSEVEEVFRGNRFSVSLRSQPRVDEPSIEERAQLASAMSSVVSASDRAEAAIRS